MNYEVEIIITGSDSTGQWYPLHHYTVVTDLHFYVNHYKKCYPAVCHIQLDIALPVIQ